MTGNPLNPLNPLFAWLLAALLAALPAFGLAFWAVSLAAPLLGAGDMPMFGRDSLLLVWGGLGLAATAALLRPLENLIRRVGYRLDSAEAAHGMEAGSDRVSDAAETALAAHLAAELERTAGPAIRPPAPPPSS